MALAAGTKLGPYEIQSCLGAGGMGEVYQARDTRLDRSVAVKVLRNDVGEIPEAKQRFDREARAISSLAHAHICSLYDVGSQDSISYIVMELLRGETLADRLEKGPLPLPQLLNVAVEICEGLAAAHRSGVIHRDLKPGNIMLTKSGAKLMDFGLAKSVAIAGATGHAVTTIASTPISNSPVTMQGAILGTFRYMSPEQIEGKEADARSDIFGLGCVLYEMATGKQAFEGKTPASIIAAVMERDPAPVTQSHPELPHSLNRVVKACLAKDPDERFQTVQDVKLQLEWLADEMNADAQVVAPAASRRGLGKWERFVWALAIVLALLLASIVWVHHGSRNQQSVIQTSIGTPEKLRTNFTGDTAGPPALSPDGSQIVFSAINEGRSQLYLRSLGDLSVRPLVGTDDARFPFWSPDGRFIAFFADSKLKRLDVSGGLPSVICDAPNARGGSWGKGGVIVFAPNFNSTLVQVAATGGTPAPVLKLDAPNYSTYRWPWFLPDGEHFLYFAANHQAPRPNAGAIFFASLDGKENRLLFSSSANAIYASGYLLYVVGSALRAQPFDPDAGKPEGDSMLLADGVLNDTEVWRGVVTASHNGMLLYQGTMSTAALKLAWFDRDGRQLQEIGEPDLYYQLRLSPDDKKLALALGEPNHTIWMYDLTREGKNRFTFDDQCHSSPVWSPDGSQLAYSVADGGLLDATIVSKSSNGAGAQKLVLDRTPGETLRQSANDWSPDGKWLIYARGTTGAGPQGTDLWVTPIDGHEKPAPYATGPGDQQEGQFSPDGRFVAYQSNETGNPEIYVTAFPWTGAKWQVSTNGGGGPRWSHDGQELYFWNNEQIWVSRVTKAGAGLDFSQHRALFRVSLPGEQTLRYAVSHDGKRFLAIVRGPDTSSLVLVQNWTAQLKGRSEQ